MHLCYMDESGHTSEISPAQPDQPPVFVLVGVSVPLARAKELTWGFLQLKKEFEPRLQRVRLSELITFELKGSSIRRDIRGRSRRTSRRALGQLDKTLRLLEKCGCQIMGKIVTKTVGPLRSDDSVYPPAVRDIAESFESLCAASASNGLMILDSRTKHKNMGNVNGITSQRFRSGGDPFPHLVEAPLLGHSDLHVPLQLVDIVASGLVFPIACAVYCASYDWNAHVRPEYLALREQFGARLQQLEYRYVDANGNRRGGFQIEDPIGRQPVHLLMRDR